MWSVACVFAELLTADLKAPVQETPVFFPGSSDIEQLGKIFEVCGTPDETAWPEVLELPCYLPFNPMEAKDMREVLTSKRKAGSEAIP